MPNQLPAYNIDAICLDAGRLTTALVLTESHKKLKEIASLIGELYDLDFETKLSRSEQNRIKATEKSIENFLIRIQAFQAGRNFDFNGKNQIDGEIDNFFNSEVKELRVPLIYLRQQAQNNISSGELSSAFAESKKIQDELRSELKSIAEQTRMVEDGKGILSTRYLSKEFEIRAEDCENAARLWVRIGTGIMTILIVTIAGGAFLLYSIRESLKADLNLQIELGVGILAIVSVMFYGARFGLGNFSIYKHSVMVSRHRKDVAETIENYIRAGINDPEMKQQLLKEAAVAMFSRDTTGFLGRNDNSPTLPAIDVIQNIGKSGQ